MPGQPPDERLPELGPELVSESERAGGAQKPDELARAAARRRRLAEVFGEVLPDSTGDDRPEPESPGALDERWYTDNRPPHHGAR
jgi:hypothetical protein